MPSPPAAVMTRMSRQLQQRGQVLVGRVFDGAAVVVGFHVEARGAARHGAADAAHAEDARRLPLARDADTEAALAPSHHGARSGPDSLRPRVASAAGQKPGPATIVENARRIAHAHAAAQQGASLSRRQRPHAKAAPRAGLGMASTTQAGPWQPR